MTSGWSYRGGCTVGQSVLLGLERKLNRSSLEGKLQLSGSEEELELSSSCVHWMRMYSVMMSTIREDSRTKIALQEATTAS